MHSFKTEMASIIFCLFSVCATEEGGRGINTANVGQNCVFPFRYNGIVYNSCTFVATAWGQGPWCSTKTNR